jgi:hypothetical protein
MSDELTQTLIMALGAPHQLPPQHASMAAWATGKLGLRDQALIYQVSITSADRIPCIFIVKLRCHSGLCSIPYILQTLFLPMHACMCQVIRQVRPVLDESSQQSLSMVAWSLATLSGDKTEPGFAEELARAVGRRLHLEPAEPQVSTENQPDCRASGG